MIIRNEDCVDRKAVLALDYYCALPFSGQTFNSLEQAAIAVLCDDMAIWQIITSIDNLEDAKSMLPEIISKRVSHQDYVERLINLVIAKFSSDDVYVQMYNYMSEDDEMDYRFEGPYEVAQFMQPYYDILSQLVTMYRRGVTNGLYMSEAVLGEI
ncbi:MAG: hypothetical protein MJZ34_03230 [Paludibacteraceae bacterium]|nr:hypothetical protein [Paludibacteraceae bacterium]